VAPHAIAPTAQDPDAIIRDAIDVMRRNLRRRPSIRDIAESVALSPYHFLRLFRNRTGITPGRFHAALKLQEAKRLLLETDQTVATIAASLGCGSVGSFTTAFGRHVGCAPGIFRQRSAAMRPDCRWPVPLEPSSPPSGTVACSLTGAVHGPAIVAAFPSRLAEGPPRACGFAHVPGVFAFAHPRLSALTLLAMQPGIGSGPAEFGWRLPRGTHVGVCDLHAGQSSARIALRTVQPLDPPVLYAFHVAIGAAAGVA